MNAGAFADVVPFVAGAAQGPAAPRLAASTGNTRGLVSELRSEEPEEGKRCRGGPLAAGGRG